MNGELNTACALHITLSLMSERTNQTLRNMIASYVENNHAQWDLHLQKFALALRTAVNETTKCTPSLLNLGREINLPYDNVLCGDKPKLTDPEIISKTLPEKLQEILIHVRDNIIAAHQKNKKYYDARHRHVEYFPGQMVMFKTHFLSKKDEKFTKKLAPKWSGPYTVHKQVSNSTYSLLEGNRQLAAVYHVLNLKPYYARMTDTFTPPKTTDTSIQSLPKRERKPPGFYKTLATGKSSKPLAVSNFTESVTQPLQSNPSRQINKITDELYICGKAALNPSLLQSLGITLIVNAAKEVDSEFIDAIEYIKINVYDSPKTDLRKYFHRVSDLIKLVQKQGGKTLIHCYAGISRSATLCIAYLMKHKHKTLDQAYRHVKNSRSNIKPNDGFMTQLKEFESELSLPRV